VCNKPETVSNTMGSLGGIDPRGRIVNGKSSSPHSEKLLDLDAIERKRKISPSPIDGPEQKRHRTEEPVAETDSANESKAKESKEIGNKPKGQGFTSYTDADVLCGRGGGTIFHPGNCYYRDLILSHRRTYDIASRPKKPGVSRKIVQMVRDRGGHFFRKEKDAFYYDIGDEAAGEKTSQALQHRTYEMSNKEDPRRMKDTDWANESEAKESKEIGNKPKGQGFTSYTDADVLSGRGGGTNLHPGNRHYRDLIHSHRRTDDIASKSKKPGVSRKIVQMARDRGGHFFRKEKDALYYDVGDEAAREKTSQALQYRILEMRSKEDPRRMKDTDSAKESEAKEGFTFYSDADVLSGKGGRTNAHPGNRHYRDLILSHRQTYDIASKPKKPGVSRKIVQMVRDRGGHFFRKEKDALYYDIGDKAAQEKTSQALCHRTLEMRKKEDPRRMKDTDSTKTSEAKESKETGNNLKGQGFTSYTDADVLSGTGGGTNLHPGNRHYRDLIHSHRRTDDIASKPKKPGVSRKIVQLVRDRGGHFCRKEKDALYYDIGDEAAGEKTSQALQHRTYEMSNKEDPRRMKDTDSAKESEAKESKETGNNLKGQGFTSYTDADVLCGRGGGTNLHPGNRHYRDLIHSHRRTEYIASKSKKPGSSRKIVQMVRDRGGHFFRKEKDALYYDIGDEAARKKTSQALRHRTLEMRNKEDPRRMKDRGGRGMVSSIVDNNLSINTLECANMSLTTVRKVVQGHSEHAPPSSALLVEGADLRGMDPSLCESLDSSSSERSERSDKLLGLSYHGLLEHDYQGALAQQRQLHAVESRHQDQAYLTALCTLRQREAILDLEKAIQDAQVRRHSSLSSGLPLSSDTPLMLGGRPLQSLGLPQHDQALLLSMADRRIVSSNSGMSAYLQARYRMLSFLPEGPSRNGY
jgi:hypothetical protein